MTWGVCSTSTQWHIHVTGHYTFTSLSSKERLPSNKTHYLQNSSTKCLIRWILWVCYVVLSLYLYLPQGIMRNPIVFKAVVTHYNKMSTCIPKITLIFFTQIKTEQSEKSKKKKKYLNAWHTHTKHYDYLIKTHKIDTYHKHIMISTVCISPRLALRESSQHDCWTLCNISSAGCVYHLDNWSACKNRFINNKHNLFIFVKLLLSIIKSIFN